MVETARCSAGVPGYGRGRGEAPRHSPGYIAKSPPPPVRVEATQGELLLFVWCCYSADVSIANHAQLAHF